MILYTATASPFGRKVKLAAHCLGLIDSITPRLTNTNDPDDEIRTLNPLGKIPALVTDDITLYDSRVILEYLDSLAGGGRLLPASGAARFEVLTRAAKMDGMMEAALLVVYESRFRPEGMQVDSVLATQRGKIIRGLESIGAADYGNGAMPDLGEIGLACLLDYLDFRKQVEWRDHAPQLVSWMADFAAAVPGYEITLPAD
ncbi:MAG TPA: glutathione S-transferase [Alphaproteobacteria bacterium]|jgi:glutathione S-transferase|nr:MAG: glutathione S-transferase [SAR116 cluster bacterium MED-G06]RPG86307.1 MAG: glutathione S-transferase [Candidatus Puniceispirillum sp. TMED245]RPG87657.1 MAG: glutathione S-transferase [Candidatus Puniceispirillum sp. TMED245]HCV88197.1 glutathione S-transferase [Alphaproteobacteria bacterium]|tara:strand:- start:3962 stop:4564 length:603 start_codon:yes stop_codon:yes gene_type:complete